MTVSFIRREVNPISNVWNVLETGWPLSFRVTVRSRSERTRIVSVTSSVRGLESVKRVRVLAAVHSFPGASGNPYTVAGGLYEDEQGPRDPATHSPRNMMGRESWISTVARASVVCHIRRGMNPPDGKVQVSFRR